MIGAATGGSNPLQPLASINVGGSSGETVAAHDELPFQRIKTVADLDREIAAASQMTEGAVKVAVHRLRQRYRELFRQEVAHTVEEPSEVNDEVRHLFAVLTA